MSFQGFAPEEAVAESRLHLVEEINHRVVNEYAEAISSLSLAARSASREARQTLAWAADRLRAHAATHRALLPPAQGGVVDLGEYVGDLCASLSKAALADHRVRITLETDQVWIAADRCWRIGLIVAELVRNATRHGLSVRPGAIVVRIAERSGRIGCVVCDNGCADANPTPGRGHRLVESIAADLGGSVDWWFTPSGSCVRLELPTVDAA